MTNTQLYAITERAIRSMNGLSMPKEKIKGALWRLARSREGGWYANRIAVDVNYTRERWDIAYLATIDDLRTQCIIRDDFNQGQLEAYVRKADTKAL